MKVTPEEITAMAKEAGFARHEGGLVCILDGLPDPELRALERFASLVAEKAAAKEREACVQLAKFAIETTQHENDMIYEALRRVANDCAEDIAAAISARGKKEGV